MTIAEVTITFTVEYDGTNEDLLKQLGKVMHKTADEVERDEE